MERRIVRTRELSLYNYLKTLHNGHTLLLLGLVLDLQNARHREVGPAGTVNLVLLGQLLPPPPHIHRGCFKNITDRTEANRF